MGRALEDNGWLAGRKPGVGVRRRPPAPSVSMRGLRSLL